jgi:WS/DGAT/MGAT family acyltransferase
MPAVDVAWLHMDRSTHLTVVTVVLSFATPVDWDRVKELCRERLIECFPRFSQRVVESRVPWRRVIWEDDPRFDIEHHLHRLALPAPGDRTALMELVGDLMATALDHDKPLWDMYLVDGYGSGCAIVCRTHHCIADGIALSGALMSLTDATPDSTARAAPCPLTADHIVGEGNGGAARGGSLGGLRRAASGVAPVLARSLLASSDTRSVLKGRLGIAQRAASTGLIRLDNVRRAAHATGTTVNDLVVSAVTAAMRAYLLERGSPVDALRAAVPLNLRPLKEPIPREMGNKFGLGLLTLPLSLDDTEERLGEVHRRMAVIKDSPEGRVSYRILSALGITPLTIERAIIDFWTAKATMVMSNVPGPSDAVFLAGTPLESILAWAPRSGSLPMSVTVFSYNGQISASLAVDARLIPDPERIAAGVEEELGELQRLASRLTTPERALAGQTGEA